MNGATVFQRKKVVDRFERPTGSHDVIKTTELSFKV